MFGKSGNVLSAADLTTYRFRTEQELPEKGQREYKPSNSWLESEQLKTALDERLQLIAEERVSRFGTLARAEWNEQMKEALVTSVVGRHWQLFGHERKTRIWLYPEEALFLVESGCLELMYSGVAVSVQQAYCILLSPNTSCTLSEYRTYAHLLRHGYRVLRHTPAAKSARSDSKYALSGDYVQLKNEHVKPVMEVVDISDGRPRPKRFSHSYSESSSDSNVHARKELSSLVKSSSFDQRVETKAEISEIASVDKKPVSKVPTEEADVTLVYEQKGPVMQNCLKPKGSLVLFPDSPIEPQSSSRTVNVTPIDIDDNELEISYVNKNVSVTLSPQKKEKQEVESTSLESDADKDVAVEPVSVQSSGESSSSNLGVEYEEQSGTAEENSFSEETTQGEKHDTIRKYGLDSDANKSQTADEVSLNHGCSNVEGIAAEGKFQSDETCQDTPEDSGLVTENEKPLASSNGAKSHKENGLDSNSATTLHTVEKTTSYVEKLIENQSAARKTASISECDSVGDDKALIEPVSLVLDSTTNGISLDGVTVEEKNVNMIQPVVKYECEDVIEIQENSNDSSHIRILGSLNLSNQEIHSNTSIVKNEWQQRTPKREEVDIEIICDTAEDKGRFGNINQKRNTGTNNYTNRYKNTAAIGWKRSASSVSLKPDVEVLPLQESSCSTSAEHVGVHRVNTTRKRGYEEPDIDIKEECSSAKKQLLNTNNWSQDSLEAVETKPSCSQEVNVINLEEEEGRLTLAQMKAVLDAIPSIENKFTIHVQAPKQDLLPPNVKPKQKDYYIQLWRLKADGFGGGPGRNNVYYGNRMPPSQPVRPPRVRPDNDGRINPWLPAATFQPQIPPLMGCGPGLLPHPMFAQAIMMAQSLAMAQSMAMNYNYRMPNRFFRGRYLHRPYFRRGYKRRYNSNVRNPPYHRNYGQGNNSYQFSRSPANEDSSDSQSRSQGTAPVPVQNLKTPDGKAMPIVIDIDDEPSEKQGLTVDSDNEVIECFEVTPSGQGRNSSRKKPRRGENRYFAPSRKFRERAEKMWHEERTEILKIPAAHIADRTAVGSMKYGRESIEVTLSSDEEPLDDIMFEHGSLDAVDEFSTDIVPCLLPENCQSVDTILSRLQIFQQVDKPRNMVSAVSRRQLRVTFDLYLPSVSFRKTTPGLPDYRVMVFSQEQFVSHYEQSMPTLGEISWALKDFDDSVPLLLAHVNPDCIQFTLFARIDLPVAPGIVCDVL
ncbi:uncharacterized protein LOC134534861 [Bacillus rossius redtenbacheri]|uniref:uncharacterized protein LOC134534861 n=1 Tax=Bacillus rossius redtenbacheri TaxID=93214 RepID=UPI002FDE60F0